MKRFLCAGLIVLLVGCSKSAPESERQLATRVLAEYVGKTAAPKSVLVLSNPFTKESGRAPQATAFEQAGIAGLKQGFDKKVSLQIAFPELRPEVLRDPKSLQVGPQSTTPLSFLVTETAFSEASQQLPNADVVVSLIGLPLNLAGYKQWQTPGKPGFGLLLPDWRMIGDRNLIIEPFRTGKLIAAVVRKPNAPEGDVTGDSKEEFDRRYLLVTQANVESLLTTEPALFCLR